MTDLYTWRVKGHNFCPFYAISSPRKDSCLGGNLYILGCAQGWFTVGGEGILRRGRCQMILKNPDTMVSELLHKVPGFGAVNIDGPKNPGLTLSVVANDN